MLESVDREIQLTGTVKIFWDYKKYGFVAIDEGGQAQDSAFLHVSVLEASGRSSIADGARVTFMASRNVEGKWRVTKLLDIDEPEGLITSAPSSAISAFVAAKIKSFWPQRGYGFFTRGHDTTDIFLHAKTVRKCGFDPHAIEKGQVFRIRYHHTAKGLTVWDIKTL